MLCRVSHSVALHNGSMKCPRCKSTQISKNGHHHGKQNYICKQCRRQFVEFYNSKGYSNDVKRICLRMYVNGMGFRGIERVTGINHNIVINWVREAGLSLPDAPDSDEIPEITELDELQTFVGKKKNKVWLWTAVNKRKAGILAWIVGDRSAETFQPLWQIVQTWQSFWYATDGYAVYAKFIDEISHIVKKTYITRVEGENTRLRHYLARLHRKTLCYSRITRNVRSFASLATSLSKVLDYPSSCLNHDLIVQRPDFSGVCRIAL